MPWGNSGAQPAFVPGRGFGGAWSNAGYGTPGRYVPGATQRRTQAEIEQRLAQLAASGQLDPTKLLDANGSVRPEVWQQVDSVGPYSDLPAQDLTLSSSQVPGAAGTSAQQQRPPGVPPDFIYNPANGSWNAPTLPPQGPGGGLPDDGNEFYNPNEITADQWARTHQAGRADVLATQSGTYWDPATRQYRTTATQGNNLLGLFGNANAAEQNYRSQVGSAQATAQNAQQQVASAEQRLAQAGQGIQPGRSTQNDELAVRAAQQALFQAQTAYNAARGGAGQVQRQGPTVEQLGQGMTPEQTQQLAQYVGSGYTGQQWEDLNRQPDLYAKDARYRPANLYRRAMAARGY
jgi:hypothetical protein